MAVPYTFGTATAAIPLSQLDSNFATAITIGNTAVQLGNTVTTLNNMTLANVTISSGTITITNVSVTTANVSGTANVSTLVVVGNETVGGNTTITGNITAANANVTTNLVLSGGTANGVAYLNTSKQVTTGSALVFDGTNLGVGAATPTAKLQISVASAAVNGTKGVRITNPAGTIVMLECGSGGDSFVGTESGSDFNIRTGNAIVTTFLNGGNVGIGVTNPGVKLDVLGGARFSGVSGTGTQGLRLYGTGTAYNYLNIDNTGANLTLGIESSAGGALSTGSSAYASVLQSYANYPLQFGTNNIIRATIDTSGNLGIGTTSINPTGLAILSGGQNKGVLVARNSSGTSPTSGQSLGSYAFKGIMDGVNSNAAAEAMIEAVAAENQSGVTAATNMLFYTKPSGTGPGSGPTSRMVISSSGIVTMSAYGSGTATFSAAGVISSVSDETWKIKDGVPIDPDAMLKKLEPGYWFYNDEKKEIFGTDRQLGFYAQNVNAAIGPEAAPTPEEGKPWGYYDRSVLAVTVMSLQKALATIETLTARITALEGA